jgi:hypothetical protein
LLCFALALLCSLLFACFASLALLLHLLSCACFCC